MSAYNEHVANLSEPRRLNPKVFVGDKTFPQELCDFVLSLALVYNDFRDVVFAQMLLNEVMPDDLTIPTRQVGHVSGLFAHLARTQAGILHELWELIAHNSIARSHPEFKTLVSSLHPEARRAWQALTAEKHGPRSKNPVARLVFFARNKVVFHYDRKEIAQGYASAFLGDTENHPYISEGRSMAAARFYFADAAAQAYMYEGPGADAASEFMKAYSPVLMQVNQALREIVRRFVTAREKRSRKTAT